MGLMNSVRHQTATQRDMKATELERFLGKQQKLTHTNKLKPKDLPEAGGVTHDSLVMITTTN